MIVTDLLFTEDLKNLVLHLTQLSKYENWWLCVLFQ